MATRPSRPAPTRTSTCTTRRSSASATARVATPAYGTRASVRPGWIEAVAATTGAPSSLPHRRGARPGGGPRPRAPRRASSSGSRARRAPRRWMRSARRRARRSGLLSRWSVTSAASLLSSACSTSRRVRSSSSMEASAVSTSGAAERGPGDTLDHAVLGERARERVDLGRGEQLVAGHCELGAHPDPARSAFRGEPACGSVGEQRPRRDPGGQRQQADADNGSANADHGQPERDVACLRSREGCRPRWGHALSGHS